MTPELLYMEEIYNFKNKKGFLLISSLFILSSMIIVVSFYLSAVTQEIRVSQIVRAAPQAYYLAEAGIEEAFFKLQNDASYKNSFETDDSWSAAFTRSDSIVPGGSYTVTIANTDIARATITATSTININNVQSQRVVKADVFKAINNIPLNDIAAFASQDINSIGSNVQITGGNLFTNDDIDLKFFSNWTVDSDAKAGKDINVSVSSDLDAVNIFDQSNPPIPEQTQTPQIDFDSDDPSSFKSRADEIYTKQEFRDMLKDFPVLALNGIIYVTGDVHIKKGHTLTINGALVSDGSISVANGFSSEESSANLYVNKVGNDASGILSKKNITFGGFNANIDIQGLVYAGGNFRIQDGIFQNVSVEITGGLIAQEMDVLVSWNPIQITYNNAHINEAIGAPLFSQVLFINHWEEEY